MDNEIELNDDGKTAYCDFCKQNSPAEGFIVGVLFYNYPKEPDELGQMCVACQKKQEEMAKAENEYYESLDDEENEG